MRGRRIHSALLRYLTRLARQEPGLEAGWTSRDCARKRNCFSLQTQRPQGEKFIIKRYRRYEYRWSNRPTGRRSSGRTKPGLADDPLRGATEAGDRHAGEASPT